MIDGGLTTAAANKGKFSIPLVWIAANRLLQRPEHGTTRQLGVSHSIPDHSSYLRWKMGTTR